MDLTPFEEAGLLDPDAPDFDGLVEMLEYLTDLGIGADDLIADFRSGSIHAAGTATILRDGELSAVDVAAEIGTAPQDVLEIYRLLGIDLPGPDAARFRREEVDGLRLLLSATEQFEGGEADEILRSASSALTQVAEAVVSVFVGGVEERTEHALSHLERAQLNQVMTETGAEFGRAMGRLFRHHLWGAVERQRATMVDGLDRQLRSMTVGFVDLVGFTPLSAEMSSAELVAFIRDFEARSYDIASRAGGRIVKTIGDEVMISAITADAGALIVLDLIDAFRTSGAAPRGGIASGAVVARQGDYFGPVVNLASRLVDQAVPGEVLTDLASASRISICRCDPAGRRMLKGFADPVEVVSISRGHTRTPQTST